MKKTLLLFGLLITTTIFAQNVPSYVPVNGLVGWWPFTGNASDSSGNANNGAVTGATLTTDRFGHSNSAYSFNGSSNYISMASVAHLPVGSAPRTISCWMYVTAYPGAWTYNAVSYGTGSNNEAYMFGTNTDTTIVVQGWTNGYAGIYKYPLNQWFFAACTYDGTNILIYANGTLIYSTTNTFNTIAGSSFTFGTRFDLANGYFTGKLDDIGIWNRALSQCEISKLYFATKNIITSNPINDTVFSSSTATFSITTDTGSATYQWQQNAGAGFINLSNGSPYSGVMTKILTINPVTPLMNDYQYRCIRTGEACPDTSGAAKLLINTTGINSIQAGKNNISIYPNPAKDNVTITATSQIETLEVYNMLGQRVVSQVNNTNKLILNLNGLAPGIYSIRINGCFVQKLIKE